MRHIIRVSLPPAAVCLATLFVLLSPAAAGAADSEWKAFSSKEGRFTINFPGKPDTVNGTVKTPDGDLETHTLQTSRNKDKELYAVSYSDFPSQKLNQSDPDKRLDAARDGGSDQVHGKVSMEAKITVDKYPGRDFEMELQGATRYYRLVLVGNRLYVIMAAPDSGNKNGPLEARKYIESFKLEAAEK